MNCPNNKCGSGDVFKCSVAYSQGTTKSEVTHFGGGKDAPLSSESTSQTEFAKKAAPPTKPSIFLPLLGLFFAVPLTVWFVAAVFMAPSIGHVVWLVIFGSLTAWSVVCFRFARAYRPQFNSDLQAWQASWICQRCGTVFVPK